MRRLSLWMKAHPVFGDSLVAATLLVLDLLYYLSQGFAGEAGSPARAPWYIALPLGLGVVLPVAFRRRHPIGAAYTTLLFSIPHAALELGVGMVFTVCIALYTLVAYVGRKPAAWYVLANVVVNGVQVPLQYSGTDIPTVFVVLALMLAQCWVLGEFVGARRAYHAEVERRLALLEVERDHQARMAVAAERARIARELHDVVAHAVSVMVVQADGAAYTLRGDPDVAEQAVRTISATGREALTELRRLLGVLREGDQPGDQNGDDGDRTPQPGTESLGELAERVRAVGLPVRLETVGDIDDLPAGVGLGIYRIVQEALTNSLKHAGPGTQAVVRLERAGEEIHLDISDDGRQAIRTLVGVAGGNGLIGMRERALVFGGTLEAGPRADGGWQVRAWLPLTPR